MTTKARVLSIASAAAAVCAANVLLAAVPASAATADATPPRTITITVSAAGTAQTVVSVEGFYQYRQRHGTTSWTFPYKWLGVFQAAVISIDGTGVWCRIQDGDQIVQQQHADGPFATATCVYSPIT